MKISYNIKNYIENLFSAGTPDITFINLLKFLYSTNNKIKNIYQFNLKLL